MTNLGLQSSSVNISSEGTVRYPVEPTRIRKHLVVYSPIEDKTADWIASHFDLVVFDFVYTKGWEKIKAFNPNVVMIGYRTIMGMHTTYEDWSEVNAHEDWFLHDLDGNRMRRKDTGAYAMDVGVQGWREHYANFVKAKLDIYPIVDGVFADSVLDWRDYHNTWWTCDPSLVPPEIQERWHNDMVGMIQHVKSIIGSKLLILNTNDFTGDYLSYADGMMHEGFIHGPWEGVDEFTQDPLLYLQYFVDLSAKEKYYLALSGAKIPDNPTQRDLDKAHKVMLYCLCSYLLVVNGALASFSWGFFDSKDGSRGYYPEMDYNTSSPSGNYYVKDGLYIRNFERARVLVNFSADTRSTVIEGESYTLEPHSAIIIGK